MERIFSEDQRELICHQGVRDRDTEEPSFRTFWLITGVLLMGFYFLVTWTPTLLVRGGFSRKLRPSDPPYSTSGVPYWAWG
jgi:hypothetical protein